MKDEVNFGSPIMVEDLNSDVKCRVCKRPMEKLKPPPKHKPHVRTDGIVRGPMNGRARCNNCEQDYLWNVVPVITVRPYTYQPSKAELEADFG